MKQLVIATLMVVIFSTSACFRDIDNTFNEYKVVELEDAVKRTPASGLTYPVISLTKTAGTQTLVANLVGEKLTADQDMTFSIDTAIYTQLNATTIRGEAGTHFNLNGGKFTIKQDSSFASLKFDVINTTVTGKSVFFVLKLDGNTDIKPSENYRRVGFKINLN